MPDLGLEVLLKGNNLGRLFCGLWIAVEISLLSFGDSLGNPDDKKEQADLVPDKMLSGIYPDYAATGTFIPCVFWDYQKHGLESAGGDSGCHCICYVGDCRNG